MFTKEIGEIIPGLTIDGKIAPYGVLNEKAVRATAAIMFIIASLAILIGFYIKDFTLLYGVMGSFFIDLFIKVFFSPKYSPLSLLGKLLVKNQKAVYVGALQKRFAWTLGMILTAIIGILVFGFQITGFFPFTLSSLFLLFIGLEASIGYCIGCSIYKFLLIKKILKTPEYQPVCADGSCDIK